MALEQHDREDLLAEATAMPIRGSWGIGGEAIFLGWRSGGEVSIYWDAEPVLQLDRYGRIRRCYWRGSRIAAVAGRLASLRANRGGRVQIERVTLTEEESTQLLDEFATRLERLSRSLDAAKLIGATEAEPEFRQRCGELLDRLPKRLAIAHHPGVGNA